MPLFVHIAPEPLAKRIRRSGIAARRLDAAYNGFDRLVWAFPVMESYTLTHQWARELKRLGARTLVAVTFRVPDTEPVLAHHYNDEPRLMKAAEAVAAIRAMSDPRGGQVVIPRRIEPQEIVRVTPLPRTFGWRYFPGVKSADRRPCDCPMCAPRGEVKAKRYRDRLPLLARRWDARHEKS
ncbi:hypothetical protein [uncultured Hyphomicrobium sp.]|uniref:hypothetical protein n=1 Tax=uncultured Hyphomicrobium sp. TaxID=194373 RepID=UPI0025F14975|nr:hypothetical protein [uncultured Hyphomicrobium sp.]